MEAISNTVPIGVLLRDRDGGEVRVGRDGEPVVRYKLSEFDAGHLRTGIDGAAQMLEAAGARRVFSSHAKWVGYDPSTGSRARFMADADAAGYGAGQCALNSFHIMGSARMGGSPATSACDPTGQTWEVRGLYVLDGSSFPSASGVNPQISIQAIAHMGARGLAAKPELTARRRLPGRVAGEILALSAMLLPEVKRCLTRPTFSSSRIRRRRPRLARRGQSTCPAEPATFHLVVPRQAHGMHKVVDPQDTGEGEAQQVLAAALPKLADAAGSEVTGSLGDSEPLMAIQDAVNLGNYDEIIISTLPLGISRWLKLDLVSKARALGLPVTHVQAPTRAPAGVSGT